MNPGKAAVTYCGYQQLVSADRLIPSQFRSICQSKHKRPVNYGPVRSLAVVWMSPHMLEALSWTRVSPPRQAMWHLEGLKARATYIQCLLSAITFTCTAYCCPVVEAGLNFSTGQYSLSKLWN